MKRGKLLMIALLLLAAAGAAIFYARCMAFSPAQFPDGAVIGGADGPVVIMTK